MEGLRVDLNRRLRARASAADGDADRAVAAVALAEVGIKADAEGVTVHLAESPDGGLPETSDESCWLLVWVQPDHDYVLLLGWRWGDEDDLASWPPPIWRTTPARRRDPEDQMRRKRAKTHCAKRKRAEYHTTSCPRCGWWTEHLVMPYYDSPWRFYGGICGECCAEADSHYDKNSWPDGAVSREGPVFSGDDLEHEVERIFGLVEEKPEKRKKGEPDPNQIAMGFESPVPPEE